MVVGGREVHASARDGLLVFGLHDHQARVPLQDLAETRLHSGAAVLHDRERQRKSRRKAVQHRDQGVEPVLLGVAEAVDRGGESYSARVEADEVEMREHGVGEFAEQAEREFDAGRAGAAGVDQQ